MNTPKHTDGKSEHNQEQKFFAAEKAAGTITGAVACNPAAAVRALGPLEAIRIGCGIIQIERSGSTQTAYCPAPVQPDATLTSLAAEGEIIERADLVRCVALSNVERVIQVKSPGVYAGTVGRFFAIVDDYDYSILARA